jgi:hypothetical protein
MIIKILKFHLFFIKDSLNKQLFMDMVDIQILMKKNKCILFTQNINVKNN